MIPSREEIMRILADSYCFFLRSLPFDNEIYMKGMGEARNKFLANLHITIIKKYLPKKYNDWRYSTDYVSPKALVFLQQGKWGKRELVYEHMVPKARYIRVHCEEAAKDGTLSADFIYDLLIKRFWTATINNEENVRLPGKTMPSDWDGNNIFARYNNAKIELIPHDKSYFLN